MGLHDGGRKHRRKLADYTIFFLSLAVIAVGCALLRVGFFYAGLDVQFFDSPK